MSRAIRFKAGAGKAAQVGTAILILGSVGVFMYGGAKQLLTTGVDLSKVASRVVFKRGEKAATKAEEVVIDVKATEAGATVEADKSED